MPTNWYNMDVWQAWTGTTATGTNADTLTNVWSSWITATTGTTAYVSGGYVSPPPWPQPTEEQKVRDRMNRMWLRWKREARHYWEDRDIAEAQARARMLLLEALDPDQRADFDRNRSFSVEINSRIYRIGGNGIAGNVRCGARRYCIHPYGDRAIQEDVMLAQKLMLETDEERFLEVANAS